MSFIRVPKRVSRGKMLHTMSKSAAWVLIAMADCLEPKDDCGRVSVPKLQEITGLSRRAVQVGLAELIESGLIERNRTTGEYRFVPENGGAQPCAGAHSGAQGGAPSCAGGRTVVRGGAHGDAQTVGRNKEVPRTLTKNDYQEGESSPFVESQPEVDEREANRAAKLLCDQTDANGKPIWRYGTNEARRLGRVWVMENHRDPDDLPALVAYGLGKAKGNAAAYIARIIEGGNWEPEAEPVMDAERREKIERLRRHREERKAAAK